jgi:hypothetical protein
LMNIQSLRLDKDWVIRYLCESSHIGIDSKEVSDL